MNDEQKGPVVTDAVDLAGEGDFFQMDGVSKGCRGRWVENKPRRIQQVKKLGYEVVPSASREMAEQGREKQKEWARQKMNSEKASPTDRKMAAAVLEQLNTSNIDTTTNIPEHVAMQISEELYQKRVLMKKKKSEQLKERIEMDNERLNVALKKVGVGGGVKGLAEVMNEMNTRRR